VQSLFLWAFVRGGEVLCGERNNLILLDIYLYMSLFGEIEKLMNSAESSFNYRVVNLGGKTLYVEGFRFVVSLGESEIILQLKKQVLNIVGANLKVKYLDKTSCVIVGEIASVVAK